MMMMNNNVHGLAPILDKVIEISVVYKIPVYTRNEIDYL